MSKTKEITVTIPEYLYDISMKMTDLGLFRDLSDLVGAGLRRELREAQQLLELEPEDWQTNLEKLRAQIQQKQNQTGQPPLTEEEMLDQLRAIRQEIWEHDLRFRLI